MSESNEEGWGIYRKLILAELQRLSLAISRLDDKLETIHGLKSRVETLEGERKTAKWLLATAIAIAALLIAIFKP